MKEFRRRALLHVSDQIAQAERVKKAQEAEAARVKAEEAKALGPKGNRRQRRAQQRFNTLLNRKLKKANKAGDAFSLRVNPDGGIDVKISKKKLVGEAPANTDTTNVVRGEELEKRLDELTK
jgi:hypothetical protein